MDILQEYALPLLPYYTTHVHPHLRTVNRIYNTTQHYSTPLINQFLSWAQDSPSYLVLAVLLIGLFIAVQVINFLRRIIAFWTRIVFKLAFYSLLVAIAALVYQRGLDRSVRDLVGFGEEIAHVWWGEYERWEGVGKAGGGGNAAAGSGYGARGNSGARSGGRVRMGNAGGRTGVR